MDIGDKVLDVVTGYEGNVVCKVEWASGLRQCGVQGVCNKGGKVPDIEYFDEARLTVIRDVASTTG